MLASSARHNLVHIFLNKGTLVKTRGNLKVRVVEGRLWITQTGHAQDVFVLPQQEFVIEENTSALIEADHDTKVEVVRAQHPALRAAGAAVDGVRSVLNVVRKPSPALAAPVPSHASFHTQRSTSRGLLGGLLGAFSRAWN